ncbi:MAG TPA: hypothetical protein VFW90_03505 [Candidatus Saccharimonadales bacterium]|nr:hypothetical protein [Candidatus Saccharimonadales bacterium]
MQFNEQGTRISLITPEDRYLAFEVVEASRYFQEGKKRPLHPDQPLVSLPWEFGATASKGLMGALERAAEDSDNKLELTPEIRSLAAHEVARLNEQLGEQKDEGLLGRLATALARFNIPTGNYL